MSIGSSRRMPTSIIIPIIRSSIFAPLARIHFDVASQCAGFIEGAHSDPANRVLTTVKHFPGHGDTDVDSHMGLPRLGADQERMRTMELDSFSRSVRAGVDAVMTAHMAVPAYETEEISQRRFPQKFLRVFLRDEIDSLG